MPRQLQDATQRSARKRLATCESEVDVEDGDGLAYIHTREFPMTSTLWPGI